MGKSLYEKIMFWLRILGIPILVFLMILAWRAYVLHKMPFDEIEITAYGEKEELEIPPRPGVQGIVITGPRIKPLFFSIDLSRAGVRPLNWDQLRLVDPYADVKITANIDHRGRLLFSQRDVFMEGHTKAGMMIQQAMKTWKYTPFKSGVIKFWFNLPSKGKKVIINTNELRRKSNVPDHIPTYDSQIHLIEGIRAGDIQIGGQI